MKTKPIYYVFKLLFRSCANDGSYVDRGTSVRQSCDCKSTPQQLAGNIAAHYLKVTETGVKVEFLGTQEDRKGAPIISMNPFVLTLERK